VDVCTSLLVLLLNSRTQVFRITDFRTQDLSFPRTKGPYGELSFPRNESYPELWNSLSSEVVNAPSLNSFRNRLDRFWMNQDILYNWHADLTKTGSRSTVTWKILFAISMGNNNNNNRFTALCPGLPGWAGTQSVWGKTCYFKHGKYQKFLDE